MSRVTCCLQNATAPADAAIVILAVTPSASGGVDVSTRVTFQGASGGAPAAFQDVLKTAPSAVFLPQTFSAVVVSDVVVSSVVPGEPGCRGSC